MLENNDLAAAKHEVVAVVRSKESEGHKIPEAAMEITTRPWFAETQAAASNRGFYQAHVPVAETLLFNDLPWIEASIGDKFTIPGKEDKPRWNHILKKQHPFLWR